MRGASFLSAILGSEPRCRAAPAASVRRAVLLSAAAGLAIAAGPAGCAPTSISELDGPCGQENGFITDCASGLVCGYAVNAGCTTVGICVPVVSNGSEACAPLTVSCGCNGGTVTYGCNFSAGYAPAPIDPALSLAQCEPGDGGS